LRSRQNSEALVKKVEGMGFAAIMFTVDSAATGNRELDKRAKPVVRQAPGTAKVATQGVAQAISGYQDPNLSWDDITWLKVRQICLPWHTYSSQMTDLNGWLLGAESHQAADHRQGPADGGGCRAGSKVRR
jgi:hypothetical protein